MQLTLGFSGALQNVYAAFSFDDATVGFADVAS